MSAKASSSSSPAQIDAEAERRNIGPAFPPVKSQEELAEEQMQSAYSPQEKAKDSMGHETPPVVRSVLELAHVMMIAHSAKLKACPGYQGGLFYRGKPFCISCGYRDSSKQMDMDDKMNHMRLKDPMSYGHLTLPVTSMLLCQLHQEGIFDMERPLVDYVPELGDAYDRLTARRVLKFQAVLDDSQILSDCGASTWKPMVALNPCAAAQTHVFKPIETFFSAGATKLSGAEQRKNLLEYVRTNKKLKPPRLQMLRQCKTISHFTVALLAAAVETQLRGATFEDTMRKKIFEPTQCHAVGYGPPKVYRDPSDMFYKPTGQALQHQVFSKPVPIGDSANCAPPLFNASLNLYAPCEDYAKLLLTAIDTIHKARTVLGPEAVTYPHYDFGVTYRPAKQDYYLLNRPCRGFDFLPCSTSFRYSVEHDVGVFALSSCGTRNGRFFSNSFSRVLQHLYVKHVAEKNIDPDNVNPENPQTPTSETDRKFSKLAKESEYTTVNKRHDAHRRY